MKKTLLIALSLGVSMLATSSMAATIDPETDRQQFIEFFKAKNPNITPEEYVNGAYVYSADKMAQWEAAEEFPPYLDDSADKMAQWEAAEEFPPYLDAIDEGEALYNKDLAVYQKCFGSDVSKIRVKYPYFDEASKQVVTLEGAINKCRTDAGLKPYGWKKGPIAQVSAYLADNARGQKIDVKIESDAALAAYNKGRDFFNKPRGQFNLSCAKCHVDNSGRNARSNTLSAALGHTTHFPVFRAKWQNLGTLHRRYEGCQKNIRAKPYKVQSETYRDLEFFQAYMSNGLEINGPGYRE